MTGSMLQGDVTLLLPLGTDAKSKNRMKVRFNTFWKMLLVCLTTLTTAVACMLRIAAHSVHARLYCAVSKSA